MLDDPIHLDARGLTWIIAMLGVAWLIGWTIFWVVVVKREASLIEIIRDGPFLQMMTVILIILAVVTLSLARIIQGELTASILSAIVGFVLGTIWRAADRPRA